MQYIIWEILHVEIESEGYHIDCWIVLSVAFSVNSVAYVFVYDNVIVYITI